MRALRMAGLKWNELKTGKEVESNDNAIVGEGPLSHLSIRLRIGRRSNIP